MRHEYIRRVGAVCPLHDWPDRCTDECAEMRAEHRKVVKAFYRYWESKRRARVHTDN